MKRGGCRFGDGKSSSGTDPGEGAIGGQDPLPLLGETPKLHKEGKNVACVCANGPHSST